jgi:predicted tellurium resistance membrane protein TerC
MSLDNVLAIAGAARDHLAILFVGLAISIALMGVAASYIARILHKQRWVAYLGLMMIVYVAFEMIVNGAGEVWPLLHEDLIE